MSDFTKALIWTAVPIVVLSVISAAGTASLRTGAPWNAFVAVWFVAGFCVVAGLVASSVYGFEGKKQIMAGILAGVGIGIVALGATCFANLGGLLGGL